jgi:hypothetical protein
LIYRGNRHAREGEEVYRRYCPLLALPNGLDLELDLVLVALGSLRG